MKKSKPIYVEIDIDSEMEKLWEATQLPHLHEKWDLRFSSITYLPKKADEPQSFSYETNLGFGLKIKGWGKSAGRFDAKDGSSRTSSLHFGTDQAISIIREGRGYWKYTKKQPGKLNFLTEYNYETNWGRFGQLFDHLFRPLIGWATALSFDVVKRWLEKGEHPYSQYFRFFSQFALTFLFFFIWTYHGLIPKIITMHPAEISMFKQALSISSTTAKKGVIALGMTELIFGLLWLFIRNKRPLFLIQMVLFPILTVGAIVADMGSLSHPFSPLTFNVALLALSIFGWVLSKDVPTARHCKRSR